jgi:hypothetical protein
MPNGIGIDAMVSEKEVAPQNSRHWVDWLSVHLWWAALLAGGFLCVVALILT